MGVEKQIVQQYILELDAKKYLQSIFEKAEFSNVKIEKLPIGTRITVYVGRKAIGISKYRKNEEEILKTLTEKFKLENPTVIIEEVQNPYLDARIVAYRIKRAIEKGINYKKAALYYLDQIINSGAIGAEIRISGKLLGKERSAAHKFRKGYILHTGHYKEELMDIAYQQAFTKVGVIGIQVKILLKAPEEVLLEKEKWQ